MNDSRGKLTDGSLHHDGIRQRRAAAVSCSVHRLHLEHILLTGSQAMAHKPEHHGNNRSLGFTATHGTALN